MHRTDRLMGIITHLQSKKYRTAEPLALQFGISVRTVFRDLRAMQEIGVPIGFEIRQGYYISGGYFLPPVSLTVEEANALALAEPLVLRFADREVAGHVSAALAKIKMAMGRSQRDHLEQIQSKIAHYIPEINLLHMNKGFTAKKTMTIHASMASVWKGLTDPADIKKYFFGTDLHTSWVPGTPIRFTGEWDGKAYEDKGTVLKFEPEQVLQYDYWSSWSGKADIPENYQIVTYRTKQKGNSTQVIVTQSGIDTLENKIHSTQNWGMLLKNLKDLLEK